LSEAVVPAEGRCYMCGSSAAGRCELCDNAFCLQHGASHPRPLDLSARQVCAERLPAWDETECLEELAARRAFWARELRRGLWQMLIVLLCVFAGWVGFLAWGWARR
jgi:NSD Cys-His rich domain